MKLTLSVRSFQVPATSRTSAWPPSLPSVPTSRATRVTSAAKERSWSTMVLTVFFSSRISPLTSTVIFLDRSPAATALVTSAMLRTWLERMLAVKLTLSVGSFEVRETPSTRAWPPSRPSVPTSRATRVTSEPKERSWSTMVLMVFFSSKNSPLTSTVIFLDRSPLATAVVTSAMLRTWPVRLLAIELTLSVRSFQVPATRRGLARPPSLPSVPTSRTTRVSSEANEPSWATMPFTTMAVRLNSPSRRTPSRSSSIDCDRSPRATAPMTRAISCVGETRSSIREFTATPHASQLPVMPARVARWLIRPCLPTVRCSRASSEARCSVTATMSLNVSAMRPPTPVQSAGRRAEKSPRRRDCRAWSSCALSMPDAPRAMAMRLPPLESLEPSNPESAGRTVGARAVPRTVVSTTLAWRWVAPGRSEAGRKYRVGSTGSPRAGRLDGPIPAALGSPCRETRPRRRERRKR